MVRFFLIIGFTSALLSGCKKENQETDIANSNAIANKLVSYDYAIDVPVNNPGVIINIDSLSFFESDSASKDTKNLIKKINELDSNFDVYEIVKSNTVKILNDNNYDYTIIDNFHKKDFPNDIITKENYKSVLNFDVLNDNYNHEDIILINVKNGFDYNEEDETKYVAKTYVYIYIINSKHQILKFSESIAGTKYIDEPVNAINTDYLGETLKQSIENTMEIIDKKY